MPSHLPRQRSRPVQVQIQGAGRGHLRTGGVIAVLGLLAIFPLAAADRSAPNGVEPGATADATELLGFLVEVSGEGTLDLGARGPAGAPRPLRPLLPVPDGALLVLGGDDAARAQASPRQPAWAVLLCATGARVHLRGTVRLTRDLCRPRAAEHPDALRLLVDNGALLLEGPARPLPGLAAGVPLLISPRRTGLIEQRPAIRWLAVADAQDYKIELVGPTSWRVHLPAREADCESVSLSIQAPAGSPASAPSETPSEPFVIAVCTLPWPTDRPPLVAGRDHFLTVAARAGFGSRWRQEAEKGRLRLLAEEQRRQWQMRLQQIDVMVRQQAQGRPDSDLQGIGDVDTAILAGHLLRAQALREAGLLAAAEREYLHLVAATAAPEATLALAEVYRLSGVDPLAHDLYRAILAASPPDTSPTLAAAAAHEGLGRLAAEQHRYAEAEELFERAADIYRQLRLEQEELQARRRADQAGGWNATAAAVDQRR